MNDTGKKWICVSNFFKSTGFSLFLFVFSLLIFLSPGFVESEDAWLYLSVSRNIYYSQNFNSAPNRYATRENVNFNAIPKSDGTWKAPGALGYSISMVPAVVLSDIYHKINDQSVPENFPLEADWALHTSVGFVHAFWGAILVVLLYKYLFLLDFSKRQSLISSLGIFFLSNLFPLAGDSFAHILFIDLFLIILIFIKTFSWQSKFYGFFKILLALFVFSKTYNFSYALIIPGITIYFYLLNKTYFQKISRNFLISLVLIPIILLVLVYKEILIVLVQKFHPIYVFESIWGLLFSSGKSIFLYNSLLIAIPIYWHKIPKKYLPEIILATITTACYLFFIGQGSILFQGTQIISPIWHGGMNWGTRYLSPVVLMGMILVFIIIKKLSFKEKLVIIMPLAIISLYVQILGVLLPYQTQYRGLSAGVKISDQILDRYSFASHIPRFSPLITQSKELIKRFQKFPATMSNGQYKVHFYDGFDNPYYTSKETFRGFKNEGFVSFVSSENVAIPMDINYYYATTQNSSASATVLLSVNNDQLSAATISANTDQAMHVRIDAKNDKNNIKIDAMFNDQNIGDTIFIKSMKLGNQNINLGSLNMPYVDYGTEQDSRREYFGVETDNWDLWQMRSALYENTFDLWWLRSFYYWDLPHGLVLVVLGIDSLILIYSGRYLYQYLKK